MAGYNSYIWIVLYQLINDIKKIFISKKGCFIKKKIFIYTSK